MLDGHDRHRGCLSRTMKIESSSEARSIVAYGCRAPFFCDTMNSELWHIAGCLTRLYGRGGSNGSSFCCGQGTFGLDSVVAQGECSVFLFFCVKAHLFVLWLFVPMHTSWSSSFWNPRTSPHNDDKECLASKDSLHRMIFWSSRWFCTCTPLHLLNAYAHLITSMLIEDVWAWQLCCSIWILQIALLLELDTAYFRRKEETCGIESVVSQHDFSRAVPFCICALDTHTILREDQSQIALRFVADRRW